MITLLESSALGLKTHAHDLLLPIVVEAVALQPRNVGMGDSARSLPAELPATSLSLQPHDPTPPPTITRSYSR